MGRKPTGTDRERFVEYLRDARDEMNLLEHSISSASTKVDRATRSIVFERTDIDPDTQEPIERVWEVKFRDGRPTAIDDDVFVALLKLSADVGFAVKRVLFTRLQVCKILGWADNGQNYKKIDDALTRLRGVSIDAKNYWFDNKLKCWRDRDFNIFDVSDVLSRTTYAKALKVGGKEAAKSWIEWSDTMMESFAAGYLRKFDLNEYLLIENPVARKLYRFLGKHFWHRTRFALELETLMHEKLGYDKAETRLWRLRQKLEPAVAELEEKGIYGLSHEFVAGYGKCEVVFHAKHKTKEKAKEAPAASPLVEQLVKYGVDREDALSATKRLVPERIIADIEHVEYEAKAGRVKASKAGMLAAMLKKDDAWPRPQGFVSSADRAAAAKRSAEADARKKRDAAAAEAKRRKADELEEVAFIEFMAKFADDERKTFERLALESHKLCREQYEKAEASGDSQRMALYLKTAMQVAWKKELGRPKRCQSLF